MGRSLLTAILPFFRFPRNEDSCSEKQYFDVRKGFERVRKGFEKGGKYGLLRYLLGPSPQLFSLFPLYLICCSVSKKSTLLFVNFPQMAEKVYICSKFYSP